jgi:hypothetical protein
MWEGWSKYADTDSCKRYELLVGTGTRVSLGVYLTETEFRPTTWNVLVNAFNPGAGEYIIYENTFTDFAEAEATAWQKAYTAELKMRD